MDPWDVIKSLKIKHYGLKDKALDEGNKFCQHFTKLKYFDEDFPENERIFVCSASGCNTRLESLRQLEAHYKVKHTFYCISCHFTLPSHYLLDRHILEAHDSFFFTLAKKKPMYACLLESCQEMFENATERKKHCIKKHNFPYDFRFDLQWKHLDTNPKKNFKRFHDQDMNDPDMDVDNFYPDKKLVNASKVNTRMISFGMGVPKTFNKKGFYSKDKYWHQKDKSDKTRTHIDSITMQDMSQALD